MHFIARNDATSHSMHKWPGVKCPNNIYHYNLLAQRGRFAASLHVLSADRQDLHSTIMLPPVIWGLVTSNVEGCPRQAPGSPSNVTLPFDSKSSVPYRKPQMHAGSPTALGGQRSMTPGSLVCVAVATSTPSPNERPRRRASLLGIVGQYFMGKMSLTDQFLVHRQS